MSSSVSNYIDLSDKEEQRIKKEIHFKKGNKIVFTIKYSRGKFGSNSEQLVTTFNVWHNRPFVKNVYYQPKTLREALESIKSINNNQGERVSTKIVYNFQHQRFDNIKDKNNQVELDQYQFLFNLSKVSFIDCSTFFIKMFFQEIRQEDNSYITQSFCFKKCKLNDYDFEKGVLDQMAFQQFGYGRNAVFSFKKCHNITGQTLRTLGQLKYDLNENQNLKIDDITNFGLKIQHQPLITEGEFRSLCSQLFSKLLFKLKLINLSQCQGTNILKEFLTYRQDFKDRRSDLIDYLKEISFDRSVCNQFDDLPLHQNWNSIQKISYNGYDKNQNDNVRFSQLFPNTFNKLNSLKLRNCILTKEFFQNLGSMQFCSQLRVLDFQNCDIDLDGFKSFLSLGLTKELVFLNLRNTNIDDDVCSMIGSQTSVDNISSCLLKLRNIDSNYLIRINITHNSCVDDTLADHFVQLIKQRLQMIKEYNENLSQNFEQIMFDSTLKCKLKYYQIKGASLLKMINLEGCKNITSSFFMTLYESNLLKNLELLNVEGTSVCNNFVEILTRQEDQNDEEDEDEDLDEVKEMDNQQGDQKQLPLNSQIQQSDQSNILKNLKKDIKEQAQLVIAPKKKFEYINVPFYYNLFNGLYGSIMKKMKLKKIKEKLKKIGKPLLREIPKLLKKLKPNLNKQKSSINSEKKVKKNKESKDSNQKVKDKIFPLQNISYLNISKCKLIDGAGILEFIMKAQCREKLRTLKMASVNLFNMNIKKEEPQDYNKLLNRIIKNFIHLEKLDISHNILPSKCYEYCKDDFTLGKLIKLNASSTNFDLDFFPNTLGSLHELQLQNCKQIKKEQLDAFITKVGSYGSEVFNIFKFLSYFKNMVNDDFLLHLAKNYKSLNSIHYWNLQRFNLVELNYDKEMNDFLSVIYDYSRIENIDLSSTRVCNKFIHNYIKYKAKGEQWQIQLSLQNCPMLDGSIFDGIERELDSKMKKLGNQRPLQILNYVKTQFKDENTRFFQHIHIKSSRKNYVLDLEQNQFLTEKGLINLLRSSNIGMFQSINLSYTHVNDEVLKVFMPATKKEKEMKRYQNLKYLKIKGCKDISKDGLQNICESTHFHVNFNLECVFDFPHLLDLNLIKIISNSLYFRNVLYLNLSKYPYQDIDLAVAQLCLKGRDTALSIQAINLNNTWISDHGLQSISVSVNLNKLERIYLNNCPNIQDKGISYLFESKNLKSLDIQYMLLQTGSKCQLRVFDTINQDEKFRKIQEIVFYENNLKFQDFKRILEKLRILSTLQSIKFYILNSFSQKNAYEILTYIIQFLPTVQYVIFPEEMKKTWNISYLDVVEQQKDKIDEQLKYYFKKQKIQVTEQLISGYQNYNTLNNIQYAYKKKLEGHKTQDLQLRTFNFEFFFKKNPRFVNSYFLEDFLLTHLSVSTMVLQNIDLSKNMNISENTLINFFYNLKGGINYINISQTYATFPVILSILTNNKIKNLTSIIFDSCCYMNYGLALIEILKAQLHPLLKKQPIFFRYKQYVNNEVFKAYCKYILNRSFKRQIQIKRVGYFSIFDDLYKLSNKLLQKFTSSESNKGELSKILDLSGSKLNLSEMKLSVGIQTTAKILNFSQTFITNDELVDFFGVSFQPQIKQTLRYVWLDNTYQIKEVSGTTWEQFFNKFPLKDFNFNELLYSRADIAEQMIKDFYNSNNRNLKLQNSIQFDLFPLITSEDIFSILKQQSARRNNTINQISISFNIENCHEYDNFRQKMNNSVCKSIKGIVVKNLYRGGISFSDSECPPYIFEDCLNTFKGLNLNMNNGLQNLIKYAMKTPLKILDLSQSIISINEIQEFLETIDIHNQIEEINLSNHQIVTDQIIYCMLYREESQEFDKFSQSNKQYSQKKSSLHQLQQQQDDQKSLSNISFNENNNVNENLKNSNQNNMKNEDEDNQKAEKSSNQSAYIQIQKVKVFPNLKKLSIEKTSLTQKSLQLILEEMPFNEQFDAESLLSQYTSICNVTDSTIKILSKSTYLRNFEILNLSQCYFSCDSLLELINSPHCLNIRDLYLNCQYLNESIFITLAKTKNFPSLTKVIANNYEQCYQSLGYLAQAKYFDINFDLERSTLLKEKLIYQSNKFINTIIGSIYMKNVKELVFDNMNDYMTSLKEFFQLAKYCYNVEYIKLTNIIDKKKYYFMWKELAESKCFPNLVSIQIDNIKFSENLHALLDQKNKPFIQLDKLLQNQKLINNQTLEILTKQSSLLNSTTLQIYSVNNFDRFADIFEKNRYLFNISNVELYDIYISLKKQDKRRQQPQQMIDFYNIQEPTPGYQQKIKDHLNEPESISQALKNISKCLPNLQRIQLQDVKLQEDNNEDLVETLNFLMECYYDQTFSVNFEVITLFNELAEKDIKLPYLKRNLFEHLIKDHKFQGKQFNLSFLNIINPDPLQYKNMVSQIEFAFVNGLTFLNPVQFSIIAQDIDTMKIQNVKQITVLERQVKIKGATEEDVINQKASQLYQVLSQRKKKEKYSHHRPRLLLQQLTRMVPDFDYLLEYLKMQKNQSEVEVILFPLDFSQVFANEVAAKVIFNANILRISFVAKDQEIDEQILISFFSEFIRKMKQLKTIIVKYSKIIFKIISGGGEYKITEQQFYELCQQKIFSEDFDITEFINSNVKIEEGRFSSQIFVSFLELDCIKNIQVLKIPLFSDSIYSFNYAYQEQKKLELQNCTNLKKIITEYSDQQLPHIEYILTQIKQRPKVTMEIKKCLQNKRFQKSTQIKFSRELKHIINSAFELDNLETDPKKRTYYSDQVKQMLTGPTSNYITSVTINYSVIADITAKGYKSIKAENIQHIHFEYIPNYENNALYTFFSGLNLLQSISFDKKKIEQSRIFHNEGSNKQTKLQKINNPLQVLLCFFKDINNVRILHDILNEFSYLINQRVLTQIPTLDISQSLTRISFYKNQSFEPISVKENIKKLIHQRNTQVEIQKLQQQSQQQQIDSNFKQNLNKSQKDGKDKDNKRQKKEEDPLEMKKTESQPGASGFKKNINNIIQANSKNKQNGGQREQSEDLSDATKHIVQQANYNQAITPVVPIGPSLPSEKDQKQTRDSINPVPVLTSKSKAGKDRGQEIINEDVEILEEGQQKQYENYNASSIDNIIDEDQLKEFLLKMPSLCELDFSFSSIKHEHVDKFKQSIRLEQTIFINFDKCNNLNRVGQLIQLVNDSINKSFQFDKFLENLPYSHVKTRKQVKKIIENIVKNPFFKNNLRYLNLGFIKKIQSKQITSDCFKGVFDPILNISDLNINMTAFLQSLPTEIKPFVTDEFIKFLTEQYSPIQFIQPEHFSQVQYAFNYIIQQPNIDNDIRIMYLLNPRFQKSISASSFRLIYESILIQKEQIDSQIKYIQNELSKYERKKAQKEKNLTEIQKNVQEQQEEMEKLRNKKREENQNKIRQQIVPNDNKKIERQPKDKKKQQFQANIERKNSQSELNDSAHILIDNKIKDVPAEEIYKFEQKQEQAVYKYLITKRRDRFNERIEDQRRQCKLLDDQKEQQKSEELFNSFNSYLLKKKEFDDTSLIFIDIKKDYKRYCIQYTKLAQKDKEERIQKHLEDYDKFLTENNAQEEKQADDQENNDKTEEQKENELEEERRRKENEIKTKKAQWKENDNKKTLQFTEEIDIGQFNNKTSRQIQNKKKLQKKSSMKVLTKEEPVENIIKEVTQTITQAHKRFNERTEILQEINQIKNSDKSSTTKQISLHMKIQKYKAHTDLMKQELQKLEDQKMKEKNALIDQDILFELFDSLNLSYNQYFNQLGLNKFILSYINPWMNINLNFEEIQQNKLINLKILSRRNFSNSLNAKVLPQSILNSQNGLQQNKLQVSNHILQNNKQQIHNTQLNDQIQNIVRSNHLLDDAIIKDLVTLISTKMHKVRKIHLSGLNVGDEFTEQFSLILSSSEQLKHLKRIQLYHNRRISSFGLKFLFSSIVERIPYGFKIDISPSLYDFESLKKSLYLLEREFITKLIRLSSAKLSQSEKDLLQFINAITKINEEEKKKSKNKGKTPKPEIVKRQATDKNIDDQKEKQGTANLLKNDENNPLTQREGILNDVDDIENMVKSAVQNNKQRINDIRQKKKLSMSDIDENDFLEYPNPNNTITIKQDFITKKEEDDDDDDEQQDDDNDEDYEYEDMIIQMKQVDQKENILDWNFLSYEGKLNKKLVEQFRDKYKQEGEALINRIVSYRKKYEKSLIQIKIQKLEEEEDDVTVMIQNLVNEGLYDTINFIFGKQWQKNRATCILMVFILFPFSIFHYIQVTTHKFNEWINNFQFDEFFKEYFSKFGLKYSSEITKVVPKTIGSQDFYFDEDVARLNSILAFEKTENNEKRQDLVVYKKFLNNPRKYLDIFKGIYQPAQKKHILRYSYYIFLFYFLIFQIGICLIWPYFLVTKISVDKCDVLPWYYDVPFYFMSMLQVIIEFAMLSDLEYVISVKQIFSLKSSLAIALTYSSFMARYDQYTDSLFTYKTLTCDILHEKDGRIYYIGIASAITMAINLLFQYYGLIYEFVLIHVKNRKTHSELHNTNYINQYTKIALISEFYGVGISLDRFSTSSANNLDYFFIPKVIRSVKIPQIFQSKFQRVFLEDIPMIAILFIYNTYYLTDQWYRWDNLKVILTTILNLYHSLHQAWIARPSIFRTYQMQEYLEFREKHSDIYRLKVYCKSHQPQEYDLQQIKLRVNEFRKKYPNIVIMDNETKQIDKKDKLGQNRDNASESKGKSENQSQRSGNSSRKDNEKSEELHESHSKHSEQDDDSHNNEGAVGQSNEKKKSKFDNEMEFKETLYNFIVTFNQEEYNLNSYKSK